MNDECEPLKSEPRDLFSDEIEGGMDDEQDGEDRREEEDEDVGFGDDDRGQDGIEARGLSIPVMPAEAEVARHNLTHVP